MVNTVKGTIPELLKPPMKKKFAPAMATAVVAPPSVPILIASTHGMRSGEVAEVHNQPIMEVEIC